ncbi:hypothetical protein SBI_05569 [Streptomyces bingchenggensis BCW-1]|uniref:Uncharacterized protein n=1 Tax=Streptomyces bingchenggensis (strain BCW-1) TaxID=749414 RepID=D7CAX2_STRBB|nr:hypothetical protein SBI_05569 [Streptomyces bingchenggensis BCW-1]
MFLARAQGGRHTGRCWFSMYWRTTVSGAPPQLPAKYEPDQKWPPHSPGEWGHLAGAGANPDDVEFIGRAVRELLASPGEN